LLKAGKVSTFVALEDAGHSLAGDDLRTYLTQLERFFAQHLAPAAAASP
jgi:hypothetical protein